MYKPWIKGWNEDRGAFLVQCTFCQGMNPVYITPSQFVQWTRGANIEKAMPTTPLEERELLISGTCPECWNKTFGGVLA